jgi:hypothetical protein
MSNEPDLLCCFCGQPVRNERPWLLLLPLEHGGEQQLWSHAVCLVRAVHPWVPLRSSSRGRSLDAHPKAKAFFAILNSANRYAILFRVQTVKRAETRAKKTGET